MVLFGTIVKRYARYGLDRLSDMMTAGPLWSRRVWLYFPMQTLFQHGLELLNQGSYFHAHDVLEEVWREVRGDERLFYQGVVQVAIAMHHFSKSNLIGAQSVLAKARRNLDPYPATFGGIDLADLRHQLARWDAAMAVGGPYPAPVRIQSLVPDARITL